MKVVRCGPFGVDSRGKVVRCGPFGVGSRGKVVRYGPFGVGSRGKKLSIWDEFCVWGGQQFDEILIALGGLRLDRNF